MNTDTETTQRANGPAAAPLIQTLFMGDCLEEMKKIPDGSVDMVLCDLPYGAVTACEWDVAIPIEPLWREYKRVLKPNSATVLTATEPFASLLRMSNLSQYKYDWVWDKHIPRGMHIAKFRPMQKHEMVLVFGDAPINYYPIHTKRDKPVRVKNYGNSKSSPLASNDKKTRVYDTKGPDSILVGMWEANKGKKHPTQKPVSLMEYLIKTYTIDGQTVLDNTMGVGATGVACVNTNRNFIGIERDPNYFQIAKDRISAVVTARTQRVAGQPS